MVTVNGERLTVIGRNIKLFRRFLFKNLHMSGKSCNFASQNAKDTKTMVATQPTFNQVYDLACRLPRTEQRQLLDKMVVYLYPEEDSFLRERRAHIAESERQIAAGMVYSEEVSDKMIDQIFDELSVVAA